MGGEPTRGAIVGQSIVPLNLLPCYDPSMAEMKKPPYMQPGIRSALGSGITEGSVPRPAASLGEVDPPGYNKHPSGPKNVSFGNGATTPVTGDGKARGDFTLR